MAIDDGIIRQSGDLGIVEMNLAMHAATPKLEAFYNYYEDTHNNSRGHECGSWVDWYGEVVCDVEGLAHLVGTEAIDASDNLNKRYVFVHCQGCTNATTHNVYRLSAKPKLLTFDHIFPSPNEILERPPRTAILYASLSSPNFRDLHSYLYRLVNKPDPHVEYVFRHIPPSTPGEKNYLSGYGVALDLKKMDYLALDDRNSNAAGTVSKVFIFEDSKFQHVLFTRHERRGFSYGDRGSKGTN